MVPENGHYRCRGLESRLARGARVVSASRTPNDALEAEQVALDLSDLASIPPAVDAIGEIASGQASGKLDLLVANAGLWPMKYSLSAQGHELAFATNVLGHHALIQGLRERSLLADPARVVIVTGDIYILASECTPDFRYRTPLGGQLAYCRSKLANLWMAAELAERDPSLEVYAVHPGVIASDLGGASRGLLARVKSLFMLSIEQGAQTTLVCATQPGLQRGAYYHNMLGRMQLAANDPASDRSKSKALWELLEGLTSG